MDRTGSIPARLRALPPARLDALLGALVLVDGVLEVLLISRLHGIGELALGFAVAACVAVAVALRRRVPVLAVAIGWSAMLAADQVGPDLVDNVAGPYFANMFVTFTAGYVLEGRRLWTAAAIASAISLLSTVADDYANEAGDFVFAVGLGVGGPLLLGQLLRNRTRLNQALHDKAVRVEGERARETEAAALEERTRIAGELHDVVAHALSAMTVQGGAAARRARPGPRARGVRARRVDRPRGAHRAAPAARRAAQGGRGPRAGAAAQPRPRRRPRTARGGVRAADAAAHRGRAAPAARRRGPDRLPARAGGARRGARRRRRGRGRGRDPLSRRGRAGRGRRRRLAARPAAARHERARRRLRRRADGRPGARRRLAGRGAAAAGSGPMTARLRGMSALAGDSLLALAIALVGVFESLSLEDSAGPLWANLAGVLVISATVAARRVVPFAAACAWLAAVLGMIAAGCVPSQLSTPFVSLFLLPYAAGGRLELRPALASIAMIWAGVASVFVTDPTR